MFMKSGRLYLFLALQLSGIIVNGQHFNLEFDHYNTNAGLSQNEVYDIVQDKQGFIWFGTDEGLNRFDGHEFKIFKHQENNTNSIIGNTVQALAVDSDSTLWIGTTNGLSRYHPKTERIEQLHTDPINPTRPNGVSVRDIAIHPDGTIWIAYLGTGVDVYYPDKNEFFHYASNRSDEFKIKNDYITGILFLPNGDKLLSSREGIVVIGKDNVPLTDAECEKSYPWSSQIDHSVTCFFYSHDSNTLWIGTELNGFYSVDMHSKVVRNFNTRNSGLLFNDNVPSLFEDSDGNLWVGGETIYLMDKELDSLIPYNENGFRESVMRRNPIMAIYEDNAKNIWLGTFRFGALKYNPGSRHVLHFNSQQGTGSIGDDKILSFNEDKKGTLWVGTDGGGLFKMSNTSQEFERAPGSSFFSSQVIKCIYRDTTDSFWLGTWDGGMMHYSPGENRTEIFDHEHANFESRHVWDIEPDDSGCLWLGTLRDGLCYFNPKTGAYKYYKNNPDDSTSLNNNDVLCLLTDSQKRLWVGTSGGVSILKSGASEFINLRVGKFPFLTSGVLCLYEDDQGRMWMGTNGGGIVVIDSNLKVIKQISEHEGLSSSTTCDLQVDSHHNIWASTYSGLFRINMSDFAISEVPQYFGLQGKEFIPRSGFTMADGRMLFGGVNGFNLFHPDSLHFEHDNVKVIFTSLKILNDEIRPDEVYQGKEILTQSITTTEHIALSHEDYSFTLTFSPLLYTWQNSLRYSYMLTPLDREWQYTTAEIRSIHYTNLSPGNYTLVVRASYDGRYWSSDGAHLSITINPPWWLTTWFQIGVFVLLVSLIAGIVSIRTRFVRKQRRRLEELVTIRTKELERSNLEIKLLLEESAKQKNDIEYKNQALSEINASLEELVNRRTESLNQTLLELETFLYRASHDLRGPITSMQGLLNVIHLEENQYLQSIHFDFLHKTIHKLERTLIKLIQKHTIQQSTLSLVEIDKPLLLGIISKVTKDMACFRSQDFEVDVQDSVLFVTDVSMFTIALTNLLENAFFFSEKAINPKVLLKAEKDQSGVSISILDNGAGIKSEIQDKIFSMFFRGHENSTGNGLGLYLVKGALDKIDGRIAVDTVSGEYSRFTMTL
jgi:ligand-binding sensor domain-containing protein/signal transduction histidine kinase